MPETQSLSKTRHTNVEQYAQHLRWYGQLTTCGKGLRNVMRLPVSFTTISTPKRHEKTIFAIASRALRLSEMLYASRDSVIVLPMTTAMTMDSSDLDLAMR